MGFELSLKVLKTCERVFYKKSSLAKTDTMNLLTVAKQRGGPLRAGLEMKFICGSLCIAAQSWGSRSDSPILAIHGWLDNSASFAPLMQRAYGCHIVAPDLPGHGRSAHLPATVPYSLETYALTMIEVAEQLQWDHFSIVGHSLGASVGILLAASMPERVDRLVMLDSVGPKRLSGMQSMMNLLDSVRISKEDRRRREVCYPSVSAAAHVRCVLSNMPSAIAEAICERDIIVKRDSAGFVCGFDRRLLPDPILPFTDEQTEALLESIQCPALLIRGGNGQLKGENIESRKRRVSSLIESTVSGEHHFHAQNPEETWAHISRFIGKQ